MVPSNKSLAVVFPKIAEEWNYEKNIDGTPSDYYAKSGKKVWWKCKQGHEWEATISNRTVNGHGCPICAGRVGDKNLSETNPELVKEWNYEKNYPLTPENITRGCHKKVWWKCAKGHEWESVIHSRALGRGCPYCTGRRPAIGETDLATTDPALSLEWNYEKNYPLTPQSVTRRSNKKVWWKCAKGHEWEAKVEDRSYGSKCPYCSGNIPIVGETDLFSLHPELIEEWDFEKNGLLNPATITRASSKKVWWRCKNCGNSWETTVQKRTAGSGCPNCNLVNKTSFPEQAVFYYVLQNHADAINSFTDIFPSSSSMEIDIYIPSLKMGIEYDGVWHNTDEARVRDEKKYQICKKNNITLIRIREGFAEKVEELCDIMIFSDASQGNRSLDDAINALAKYLSIPHDVDVSRDNIKILENYLRVMKENSLEHQRPDLAKEWNYEQNGRLTPLMVKARSHKIVWWKCKRGHEWRANILSRTYGSGCPYCAGRYPIVGETDLYTINPDLAREWDYEKNYPLTPKEVTTGSHKKVYWKCSYGHEWQAEVKSRNEGHGCPFCAGQNVESGKTDLATTHAELAKEWNYEKNYPLTPQDVKAGSEKKVWWKCSRGHEWQATIKNRKKGFGCPYCSGRLPIVGETDLATTNPELVLEWNYEKNFPLTPQDVKAGSEKKVWWKCKNGHEWQAMVYCRKAGTNCPECRKKKRNLI